MSVELKSCPFCGGEARLIDVTPTMPGLYWRVECASSDKHKAFTALLGKDEAIATWNTRATSQPVASADTRCHQCPDALAGLQHGCIKMPMPVQSALSEDAAVEIMLKGHVPGGSNCMDWLPLEDDLNTPTQNAKWVMRAAYRALLAAGFGSAAVGDLPVNPALGDGRIWDGEKWLKTAPTMQTYAMLEQADRIKELEHCLKACRSHIEVNMELDFHKHDEVKARDRAAVEAINKALSNKGGA